MDGMNKFERYQQTFETLRVISQAHGVVIVTATQPKPRRRPMTDYAPGDTEKLHAADIIITDYADKFGG